MRAPDEPWFAGARIVVTAGGTREPIDPVRFLGNRSTGKMGNALAVAAARHGAGVTLITAAAPPEPQAGGCSIVRVETAAEMLDEVRRALPGARTLIMAAAVADWRPASRAPAKLKKHAGPWMLELVPTVDILASLRDDDGLRAGVFVVGFAAETDNAVGNGHAKLRDKDLDLIVVNDVSRPGIGMGADDNEVTLIGRDGSVEHVGRAPKAVIAEAILRSIAERIG